MNSSSNAPQPELAEPHLRAWLASVGLDVEYVRGEGNTLVHLDGDGAEVPVLDLAGGYGSLILGHNHPELLSYAVSLLQARTPIHAQFSGHPYANRLANALSAVLRRELEQDEDYSVIFANSGAEAVEAGVKHAELDRVLRVSALLEEIEANIERAGEAVAAGRTRTGAAEFAALAAEVRRNNAESAGRKPLFLALEGSFHGKLVGSVQLTHNPGYRTPFSALAAQARFVPLDRPEAIRKVVEAERATVLDLVVDGDAVRTVEREFPVFAAFVLEPIQGEGGINVVSAEFAAELQRVAAAVDAPVIVDEVQSGMGRSGAFLASSLIGLRGDYYTLSKSLGGGIAKTAVLLVRQSRYRPEFELVHSSTFAKDSFSTHIALRVLEMLEADGGRVYRLAEERGRKLTAVLEAVRADFPDVVKAVRGRGLMLGLEFHDQSESASAALRESAATFGYVLAGHLLREHRIRIFPTASAVNTLRFEPSVHLTDEEIDQVDVGLRDTCALLRAQDGERLLLPA